MKKIISIFIIVCFIASNIILPANAQMFAATPVLLPEVGSMISLSKGFNPTIIRGLTINLSNPLEFDFIVDHGDELIDSDNFQNTSNKLVRYFLAALTVPEKELWVNLSPYEKERVIPESFSQTEMGRDLLAQDYLLKQLTSSLMYPDGNIGEKFWQKIYDKAYEKFGTTQIPTDTFNKVWIAPLKAVIYEHNNTAFVVESRLRVMLESDFIALQNNVGEGLKPSAMESNNISSDLSQQIIKEIIIPELEKEVNVGKNFAQLRQVYNSLILATWYKKNLKQTLLGQIYADKNKVKGIDLTNKEDKQEIYDQYVDSFKKGVFNYIKEEYDPSKQQIIPRKYFSGGIVGDFAMTSSQFETFSDKTMLSDSQLKVIENSADGKQAISNVKINLLDVGPKGNMAAAMISSFENDINQLNMDVTFTEPGKFDLSKSPTILIEDISRILNNLSLQLETVNKDIQSSVTENLKAFLKSERGALKGKGEWAIACDIPFSTFSQLSNGNYNAIPGVQLRLKLARGLGVDVSKMAPKHFEQLQIEKQLNAAKVIYGKILSLTTKAYRLDLENLRDLVNKKVDRSIEFNALINGKSTYFNLKNLDKVNDVILELIKEKGSINNAIFSSNRQKLQRRNKQIDAHKGRLIGAIIKTTGNNFVEVSRIAGFIDQSTVSQIVRGQYQGSVDEGITKILLSLNFDKDLISADSKTKYLQHQIDRLEIEFKLLQDKARQSLIGVNNSLGKRPEAVRTSSNYDYYLNGTTNLYPESSASLAAALNVDVNQLWPKEDLIEVVFNRAIDNDSVDAAMISESKYNVVSSGNKDVSAHIRNLMKEKSLQTIFTSDDEMTLSKALELISKAKIVYELRVDSKNNLFLQQDPLPAFMSYDILSQISRRMDQSRDYLRLARERFTEKNYRIALTHLNRLLNLQRKEDEGNDKLIAEIKRTISYVEGILNNNFDTFNLMFESEVSLGLKSNSLKISRFKELTKKINSYSADEIINLNETSAIVIIEELNEFLRYVDEISTNIKMTDLFIDKVFADGLFQEIEGVLRFLDARQLAGAEVKSTQEIFNIVFSKINGQTEFPQKDNSMIAYYVSQLHEMIGTDTDKVSSMVDLFNRIGQANYLTKESFSIQSFPSIEQDISQAFKYAAEILLTDKADYLFLNDVLSHDVFDNIIAILYKIEAYTNDNEKLLIDENMENLRFILDQLLSTTSRLMTAKMGEKDSAMITRSIDERSEIDKIFKQIQADGNDILNDQTADEVLTYDLKEHLWHAVSYLKMAVNTNESERKYQAAAVILKHQSKYPSLEAISSRAQNVLDQLNSNEKASSVLKNDHFLELIDEINQDLSVPYFIDTENNRVSVKQYRIENVSDVVEKIAFDMFFKIEQMYRDFVLAEDVKDDVVQLRIFFNDLANSSRRLISDSALNDWQREISVKIDSIYRKHFRLVLGTLNQEIKTVVSSIMLANDMIQSSNDPNERDLLIKSAERSITRLRTFSDKMMALDQLVLKNDLGNALIDVDKSAIDFGEEDFIDNAMIASAELRKISDNFINTELKDKTSVTLSLNEFNDQFGLTKDEINNINQDKKIPLWIEIADDSTVTIRTYSIDSVKEKIKYFHDLLSEDLRAIYRDLESNMKKTVLDEIKVSAAQIYQDIKKISSTGVLGSLEQVSSEELKSYEQKEKYAVVMSLTHYLNNLFSPAFGVLGFVDRANEVSTAVGYLNYAKESMDDINVLFEKLFSMDRLVVDKDIIDVEKGFSPSDQAMVVEDIIKFKVDQLINSKFADIISEKLSISKDGNQKDWSLIREIASELVFELLGENYDYVVYGFESIKLTKDDLLAGEDTFENFADVVMNRINNNNRPDLRNKEIKLLNYGLDWQMLFKQFEVGSVNIIDKINVAFPSNVEQIEIPSEIASSEYGLTDLMINVVNQDRKNQLWISKTDKGNISINKLSVSSVKRYAEYNYEEMTDLIGMISKDLDIALTDQDIYFAKKSAEQAYLQLSKLLNMEVFLSGNRLINRVLISKDHKENVLLQKTLMHHFNNLFASVRGFLEMTKSSQNLDDIKKYLSLAKVSIETVNQRFNLIRNIDRIVYDADILDIEKSSSIKESLIVSSEKQEVGGINLDPSLLDMQIKRDKNNVALPVGDQPLIDLDVQGFIPVIINITPATNLNLLLGLSVKDLSQPSLELAVK